ncbi:Integral membrane protein TerC [Stackebrandtia nassauensis DSM 44728]|uniref:Integral membrane protein TerC n=1 Tax=Stackebrandtia nassauensis (strain DSM 44728 / CIP 108903 / NRRL B-16338 / NBRC 102104 / LLR-40K-21) TaxID=446470 RepID=D3PXT7_STANL|nr:TerC family protein [Stackebrandtia nassauensis]ADD43417.1 Integral membrane protein TerC [Stackebrandtia nassauensis DSM 44728]
MTVPFWVWALTIVGVLVILTVDLAIIGRRPHEPSTKEATLWVAFYLGLAAAFGAGVWLFSEPRYGGEFFAGWITEYSMSVDNLFVFILIMSSFAVPRKYQQKVLMIGIIMALILRAVFIGIGAGLVNQFVWVFFIFGAFLIFTAIQLLRGDDNDDENYENAVIRWTRRVVPVSKDYDGAKITTKVNGRRVATPMLIVMVAIGSADLLFAVDSIPATFGLTKEAFLVFTVNVFALMGLRQLYFLLGGLLQRLVYLNYGLAAILGFIGVKLVFHALHDNDVPFINGGKPVPGIPDINTWVSLGVIVGILVVATVASLIASRGKELPAPGKPEAGSETEGGSETAQGQVEPGSGEAHPKEGTSHPGGGKAHPATVHHLRLSKPLNVKAPGERPGPFVVGVTR